MIIVKYDDESWFLDWDKACPVSDYVWTGIREKARRFENDHNLHDLLECLVDDNYLPVTIEQV